MQQLIEDGVRLVGWLALKALTLGRYRGRDESDRLLQGTIGLLLIAGILWATYKWWSA